MNLIFVTHNKNKTTEVSRLLPPSFQLKTLDEIGEYDEIPETGNSFEENALIKARHIYNKYKCDCFADDSGLEVETLDNAPGVYSARYAGEPKNDAANTDKLLGELSTKTNRNARFRTVIALIISEGKEYTFEGEIKGKIIPEKRGEKGFGYDPVFTPEGYEVTFAEMELADKNKISHRAKAIAKLIDFLRSKT